MTVLATVVLAATFTRTMERVATMDPAMTRSIYDSHAVQLVYETPLEVDYKARPYKLVPGFCELPEVSKDGLTYVFKVRKVKSKSRVEVEGLESKSRVEVEGLKSKSRVEVEGLKSKSRVEVEERNLSTCAFGLEKKTNHHSSTSTSNFDSSTSTSNFDSSTSTSDFDFTSSDMVRSLERLRDPAIVSPNGWIMKDVDTVKAPDPGTVEIRLKRRCHFFPWLMAHGATGVRGPNGEGSGAYRLASWRKNHEMVFERRKSKSRVEVEGLKSKSRVEVEERNLSTCAFGLEKKTNHHSSTSTSNFDSSTSTSNFDSSTSTSDFDFTSSDMVRSLERLRDPAIVSPNGWIMKDVDTVKAPDPGTVEIRLKRRCHFFPWLMAHGATGVRGPNGEGSGAYRLASWRKNHEMVFERRKSKSRVDELKSKSRVEVEERNLSTCAFGLEKKTNHHSSTSTSNFDSNASTSNFTSFDTVRYLVIDDMSTQWLMFLKGELDLLGTVSRDNFDSIVGPDGRIDPSLEREGVTLHSIPTLESMHLGFNMRDPVVGTNRKLRQALNAAFDFPAWEKFYNGRILPSTTPVPPGVDGQLQTPFAYSFDLEKAKRLMAEAGYPNGIDPKTGRRLVLTLSIGRASQESREAAELMAAFYEKLGIKLEAAFMTWDAYLKAINEGRFQIFRMGWVGDYPDAQNFLQLFYSKNVSPGPNHAYYVNPDYDRVYDAALAAVTDEERNRHWAKCQEILREDCPWVFTHYNKAYSLVRPTVKNYVPTDFPYGTEKYYESAVR